MLKECNPQSIIESLNSLFILNHTLFDNPLFLRIKSTCCVQFSTSDQASETRMALDGVTWPQGNNKVLRVAFSSAEQLKKYKEVSRKYEKRWKNELSHSLSGSIRLP